jgi:hypothetical protein
MAIVRTMRNLSQTRLLVHVSSQAGKMKVQNSVVQDSGANESSD